MSHVFYFRKDFKEANTPFITQQKEWDGCLWKITANLWNKKPWQNTDDEITAGRDGMRIMSDVPAGAKLTLSSVKLGGFSVDQG